MVFDVAAPGIRDSSQPHGSYEISASIDATVSWRVFLPDALLFPPRHQVVRPHLFTNAEVVRLQAAIGALPAAPTSPFRRENLHLAIVLLYTAGLRLGERPIDQLRLAPER